MDGERLGVLDIAIKEDDIVISLVSKLSSLSPDARQKLYEALEISTSPADNQKKQSIISSTREKIPLSIFCEELGAMEAIVVYLHDNQCISFANIAQMLNRNGKSIWASYNSAKQKHDKQLVVTDTAHIPAFILRQSGLGALEAIAFHLREKRKYTFREIGLLLSRHENTIRTAHHRAWLKNMIL